MTAPFVQRFHAALTLLLTVALTLSVLQGVAAGASPGIETRVLTGPAFLAWSTYTVVWQSPRSPLTAVGLLLAVVLSALMFGDALRHKAGNHSALPPSL
jgi:hypothetical protein